MPFAQSDERWPLSPLVELTGFDCPQCHEQITHGGTETFRFGAACESVHHFRLRLPGNQSFTTVSRAKRDGLTDVQADHWAIKFGYLPQQVWPDWHERVDLEGFDVWWWQYQLAEWWPPLRAARTARIEHRFRQITRARPLELAA